MASCALSYSLVGVSVVSRSQTRFVNKLDQYRYKGPAATQRQEHKRQPTRSTVRASFGLSEARRLRLALVVKELGAETTVGAYCQSKNSTR